MSLLAYIWQTIMRKTHFGGTFFRFFTFGTAIHKRNITGQNTKSAIHKRDIALFPQRTVRPKRMMLVSLNNEGWSQWQTNCL